MYSIYFQLSWKGRGRGPLFSKTIDNVSPTKTNIKLLSTFLIHTHTHTNTDFESSELGLLQLTVDSLSPRKKWKSKNFRVLTTSHFGVYGRGSHININRASLHFFYYGLKSRVFLSQTQSQNPSFFPRLSPKRKESYKNFHSHFLP